MSRCTPSPAPYLFHRALRTLSLPILIAAGCAGPVDPEAEFAAAERAVERWVARHATGWTLQIDATRGLHRPEWSKPCSANPESGLTVLRYRAAGTEIDLLFRCPIGPGAGTDALDAALAYVVLQELPHGIAVRGWRFRVVTPTSSIDSGFSLEPSPSRRLALHIDTPLYAVLGNSERPVCQPPADAPYPPGCSLAREYRLPLRLRLTLPADEVARRLAGFPERRVEHRLHLAVDAPSLTAPHAAPGGERARSRAA
jgi:hypothetical protein